MRSSGFRAVETNQENRIGLEGGERKLNFQINIKVSSISDCAHSGIGRFFCFLLEKNKIKFHFGCFVFLVPTGRVGQGNNKEQRR